MVEPLCVALRAKGTRTTYRLTWAKIMQLAEVAEAEARRAAKLNGRQQRRNVRRSSMGL